MSKAIEHLAADGGVLYHLGAAIITAIISVSWVDSEPVTEIDEGAGSDVAARSPFDGRSRTIYDRFWVSCLGD
ncbi:hypothetical protein ACFQ3B_08575 [Stackebrandtia endophytica]|uniref:hypothetical protein n=1 Tax=Stackebrandtia endophytica TaxID=1496996 RepID=UPI001151C281|nr:hypothetical protein [Stackebrandtia endophytica]